MTSKLTVSLAIVFALSAAGGVARANPMPTSTDEARALAADVARAPISRWFEALIARDHDEGRAAAFAGDQEAAAPQSVAAAPAASGTTEQGN